MTDSTFDESRRPHRPERRRTHHQRRPRGASLTVSGALLFALTALVSACQEQTAPPVVSAELQDLQADHMMLGMNHEMTQEGVRYASLRADTAFYYADSTKWELYQIDMTVYTTTGEERATMESDWGELDEETEAMVARGNVVLLLLDRDGRLESSELHYDPLRKRFWSDSATVFREGGTVTRGSGFESDLEFTNVRITNASARGGGIIRF